MLIFRTLKDTALRETFEEVGIAPNNVEIWGKAPEILRPGMLITPYLGYVEAEDINNLKINSNEVSFIYCNTFFLIFINLLLL